MRNYEARLKRIEERTGINRPPLVVEVVHYAPETFEEARMRFEAQPRIPGVELRLVPYRD